MARLFTAGFESGIPAASPYGGERDGAVESRQTNTTTYQSSVARNGGRALQCSPSAANYEQITGLTHTVDVPTYARFYLRISSAPSTTVQIWAWRLNAVVAADISLLGNRTLQLNAPATGVIGTSFALTVDTWYRVETSITIPASGNGSVELRIDGVTQTSGAANVGTTLTTTTHRIGHVTAGETATTLYYDDLAINDGNGANQNTWPGPGNVTLLKPTGDNATGTGWEGPQTTGSDTTNLYDNVDNVPPTGVAHSDVDANAGKYAFNAANLGAASDFRVNCQSMSDAGIPSNAIPVLSQSYMRASCHSATGTNNMELQGITPADSAVTCNVEATAVAGTEPTGWKSFRTIYTSRPSLAHATNPVIEATKILTGSTRAHMVDQMGLLVEWVTPVDRSAAVSAATLISSSATFYSVLSAAAALSATGAITTAHQRELLRSVALSAATAVTSQATFFSTLERSASLSAATSVSSTPQRDHLRAATVSAVTGISSAGAGETPTNDVERSAAISASTSIQASAEHDLIRGAALSASTSITTAYQRDLLRALGLSATTVIATAHQRDLLRASALSAETLISTSGGRFEEWTYGGGTLATYGGSDTFTYGGGGTLSYGSDDGLTYGGTLLPTYTYGG